MKISEIERPTEVNKKILNVLKILFTGRELKAGSNTIFFAVTNTGSVQPCLRYPDDNFIGMDCNVSGFFNICERVSDDDITKGLAEISLTEIKKNPRREEIIDIDYSKEDYKLPSAGLRPLNEYQ